MWLIYALIVMNPGLTLKQLAGILDMQLSRVEGIVISRSPFRVCEGNEGKLYPYSRHGRLSAWLVQATS